MKSETRLGSPATEQLTDAVGHQSLGPLGMTGPDPGRGGVPNLEPERMGDPDPLVRRHLANPFDFSFGRQHGL